MLHLFTPLILNTDQYLSVEGLFNETETHPHASHMDQQERKFPQHIC